MSDVGRNRQTRRQLRILARMLDMRGHSLRSFQQVWLDDGIKSKKTQGRDMEALMRIPELAMIKYQRNDITYWRITAQLGPKHNLAAVSAKDCFKCGATKPVEEFIRDARSVDGYRGLCKKCNAQKRKDWVDKNRKQFLAHRRKKYNKASERQKEERSRIRKMKYALKREAEGKPMRKAGQENLKKAKEEQGAQGTKRKT